jgi:hypothetical protein
MRRLNFLNIIKSIMSCEESERFKENWLNKLNIIIEKEEILEDITLMRRKLEEFRMNNDVYELEDKMLRDYNKIKMKNETLENMFKHLNKEKRE